MKSETVSLGPIKNMKLFHLFLSIINETVSSVPPDHFQNCFNRPPTIVHSSLIHIVWVIKYDSQLIHIQKTDQKARSFLLLRHPCQLFRLPYLFCDFYLTSNDLKVPKVKKPSLSPLYHRNVTILVWDLDQRQKLKWVFKIVPANQIDSESQSVRL